MSSYRTKLYPVTGKPCLWHCFQVLTSRIWLRVLLGLVLSLWAGLLSGMVLQPVLTTLPLSDAFVWALSMRHVISIVIFYYFLWTMRSVHPGPISLGGSATAGIRARRLPTRDGNLGFQTNNLKLDFKLLKFLKELGSPRTSLGRKALGNLVGIIRWLILYG